MCVESGGVGTSPAVMTGVVMRKRLIAALITALLTLGVVGPAAADPQFGPGNAGGAAGDAQSKCHPPGQTTDTPGCK